MPRKYTKKVVVAETPPQVNVFATMMLLQKKIKARTTEDWFTVAAIRALNADDPASSFNVFARVPGDVSEFLTQCPPDASGEMLDQVADDVVAFHAAATKAKEVQQLYTQTENENGEIVNIPFVPQMHSVVTIDPVTLKPVVHQVETKPHYVRESVADEEERINRILAEAPQVQIYVDTISDVDLDGPFEVVAWNGRIHKLRPGLQAVPKPLADQWEESKKAFNYEAQVYRTGLDDNGKLWGGSNQSHRLDVDHHDSWREEQGLRVGPRI